MSVEQQIETMEKQLSNFDGLLEKLQYMSMFFDPDPEFTQEARNIVRSNMGKATRADSS
jgi:hypothetical protein